MFTIEVKKRGKDEEFSFKDLEMFHQECGAGKIKPKPYNTWYTGCVGGGICQRELGENEEFPHIEEYGLEDRSEYHNIRNFWRLVCQRCQVSIDVEVEPQPEILEIIKTAIDGQERKIRKNNKEINVIQKA